MCKQVAPGILTQETEVQRLTRELAAAIREEQKKQMAANTHYQNYQTYQNYQGPFGEYK
jgi:hypothetical protein